MPVPRVLALLVLCLFLLPGAAPAAGPQPPSLAITGLVAQPISLSLDDLRDMATVKVKLNDLTSQGEYHGAWTLKGVPLATLLELAKPAKPAGGFPKLVDCALLVRGAGGSQTLISWGEVGHKNPADIVIAVSCEPVMPKRDCAACHTPAEYEPWMNQLKRPVGLPRLVVASDIYSDRCLEGVTSIEVVSPSPGKWGPKVDKLYAPDVTVSGQGKDKTFKALPPGAPVKVAARQFGDGKGFHGHFTVSGRALKDVAAAAGLKPELTGGLLITAPDGYRSLVSWGELVLNPLGARVVLADQRNGKVIGDNGRFQTILPDDLYADRWVKSTSGVQAVSFAAKPTLYVIGMGCGDPNLLTLEALSALSRVQSLAAPEDIQKRYRHYLAGKKVVLDPMKMGRRHFNKSGEADQAAARKAQQEAQAQAVEQIRAELAAGRSLALLDWGDPMIYGSWRWLGDYFPKDQIVFIPGMSAFNAGSAAIGRDITCNGLVALSDPFTVMDQPGLMAKLAKDGSTLVMFMGLPKFKPTIEALQKNYPPETPAALVIRAGYQEGEKVLRTTLDKLVPTAQSQGEKWLGITYVGPCLEKGWGRGEKKPK